MNNLQKFLNDKEIQNLINDNKFEEVYHEFIERFKDTYAFMLTEIFWDAGLEPLEYMKKIPYRFLPDDYTTKYEIPDGVEIIYSDAFVDGTQLKTLIIPKSVKRFDDQTFYDLENIVYKGFKKDFLNLVSDSIIGNPRSITVICEDWRFKF